MSEDATVERDPATGHQIDEQIEAGSVDANLVTTIASSRDAIVPDGRYALRMLAALVPRDVVPPPSRRDDAD